MNTLEGIPARTIREVAMVGTVVTYAGTQWVVYSVEGYDYYAFQSAADRNEITCDLAMTPAEWKRDTVAMLLPMGAKIGEGLGKEVPVRYLRRGVTLTKQGDSVWH